MLTKGLSYDIYYILKPFLLSVNIREFFVHTEPYCTLTFFRIEWLQNYFHYLTKVHKIDKR